ncbi:MAG: hypothetical protein H6571_18710 [Lewinellaceae bacterium]|nr:hypothetical protein [Lewinellaceae bacterium]
MTDQVNWALINTLISASVGALVALITIFVDGRRKRNERKRVEYDTYKRYSKPIMFAAETLAWRLREVLMFKGAFLLPDAPMNGFFKYKFESTVYRLCVLIGWIRAAKKEHSYIEGFEDAKSSEIRDAINNFQRVLADGSHVEVSIFEELSKSYGLEIKQITPQTRQEIGVELERIVFKYIPNQIKKNVSNLERGKQLEMVKSIMDFICYKTNQQILEESKIKEKIEVSIDEIAREFCWIYRDWQNAIGDEMLTQLEDSYRHFDVIGFGEFITKHEKSDWLKKVDNLFSNLDVSIDNRFDTRVSQVKRIYITLVKLIDELNKAIEDEQAISKKELKILIEYQKKLKEEIENMEANRLARSTPVN